MKAETRAAMGRADAPADTQWARALIAVALALVFAAQLTGRAVSVPSLRTIPPELRALAGIPSLVIRHVAPEL